jgi:hypothetical protein
MFTVLTNEHQIMRYSIHIAHVVCTYSNGRSCSFPVPDRPAPRTNRDCLAHVYIPFSQKGGGDKEAPLWKVLLEMFVGI